MSNKKLSLKDLNNILYKCAKKLKSDLPNINDANFKVFAFINEWVNMTERKEKNKLLKKMIYVSRVLFVIEIIKIIIIIVKLDSLVSIVLDSIALLTLIIIPICNYKIIQKKIITYQELKEKFNEQYKVHSIDFTQKLTKYEWYYIFKLYILFENDSSIDYKKNILNISNDQIWDKINQNIQKRARKLKTKTSIICTIIIISILSICIVAEYCGIMNLELYLIHIMLLILWSTTLCALTQSYVESSYKVSFSTKVNG